MSAEVYAKIDSASNINLKGNSKDLTAPVKSYYPNELGLYNMCGNVAEMVYNSSGTRTNPGTAGGSWLNTKEEIKIYGSDSYDGRAPAFKHASADHFAQRHACYSSRPQTI